MAEKKQLLEATQALQKQMIKCVSQMLLGEFEKQKANHENLAKSYTKPDFQDYFTKVTGFKFDSYSQLASTFDKYLTGYSSTKSFPKSDLFNSFKKFGNKCNVELLFESKGQIFEYEHQLLYEIIDKLKASFEKYIIGSYTGPIPLFDDVVNKLELCDDKNIAEIVKQLWYQFDIMFDNDIEATNRLIDIAQKNPSALGYGKEQVKSVKINIYSHKLDLIKSYYEKFFSVDDESFYSLKGKRINHYNQIKDVTLKKIQDAGLLNVLKYTELVGEAIKSGSDKSGFYDLPKRNQEYIYTTYINMKMSLWDSNME